MTIFCLHWQSTMVQSVLFGLGVSNSNHFKPNRLTYFKLKLNHFKPNPFEIYKLTPNGSRELQTSKLLNCWTTVLQCSFQVQLHGLTVQSFVLTFAQFFNKEVGNRSFLLINYLVNWAKKKLWISNAIAYYDNRI